MGGLGPEVGIGGEGVEVVGQEGHGGGGARPEGGQAYPRRARI